MNSMKGRKIGPFSLKSMANNAAIYWQNKGYRVVGPRKTADGWFLYVKRK